MALRGIRGAITVNRNSRKDILSATGKLLNKMVSVNGIKPQDVASVFFSVTRDLNADFPAFAARKIGWLYTPLICLNEIPVPGSLKKCIRILIHVNTTKKQENLKHIYLGKAKKLRPDLGFGKKDKYYISNS